MKYRYTHVFNLYLYTPKLWERVVLKFLPLKSVSTGNVYIEYKEFLNRMYIYWYETDTTIDNNIGYNYTSGYDKYWEN